MWPEVDQAKQENRHELRLVGSNIAERIEKNGLDENIFALNGLNFLEISKTSLSTLPAGIGNLANLQSLLLYHNQINELTGDVFSKLAKLKVLDLSTNQIASLPEEVNQLAELHSLNLSFNKLSSLPDLGNLQNLHVLNVSNNCLEQLPEGVDDGKLANLAEVIANNNEIAELSAEIVDLPSLKLLDVTNNKLQSIPSELGECPKLREFKFSANKLKDRRLAKMMEQCTTKSVMDYLRNALEKERQKDGKGKGKGKKDKKKKKDKSACDDVDELVGNVMKVLHFPDDSVLTVRVMENVASVRPYIVCCAVRNLNFHKSNNLFKRFIALQTALHDGICQKRQTATIATHDLKSVKAPLTYDARPPAEITLQPLFMSKQTTANVLVAKLRKDAEELRKEKKRNTISGVHKYLDLLKGKSLYPCLLDNEGTVVSFPPITNCEVTKISADTEDILIEVTSNLSLDVCKKVLEETLREMLELGVGQTDQDRGDDSKALVLSNQHLVVEQVKVLDAQGSMKVVYPARNDLQSEGFKVVRDYE